MPQDQEGRHAHTDRDQRRRRGSGQREAGTQRARAGPTVPGPTGTTGPVLLRAVPEAASRSVRAIPPPSAFLSVRAIPSPALLGLPLSASLGHLPPSAAARPAGVRRVHAASRR
ncbi:hypothetical protein [Streptomyces sp. NPDC008121]|uniref:hypothetical protein n=1 Tax=Streptomyces sp. NPDC008121 TaxID=3364809 RepID=UPI0036EA4852